MELKQGCKVRITFGSDIGKIGIFKGMQNNSNWYKIDIDGQIIFMNTDEFVVIES